MTQEDLSHAAKARILACALPHVPFDGWSETTLAAAIAESGTPPGLARALFPRGGIDLALAYHGAGDQAMLARLAEIDLSQLRFRDRIARAVRCRLEAADRELVRRGAVVLSLPAHAAEGTRALWGTADAIWTALGDRSRDVNWYTKRATLSAVYGASVLFWLGDDSAGNEATWAFVDRRIADVMEFEAAKARFRENPFGKALLNGPLKVLEKIHAPEKAQDLPGKI